MSSYIVEDQTIDRIISGLIKTKLINEFKDIQILDNSAFGQELIDMNTEAVDYRYSEKNDKMQYKFTNVPVTEVQAFKSLQCLLYQCCEGPVPDSKLYKQMREIGNLMAVKTVNDLPSYEKAQWG